MSDSKTVVRSVRSRVRRSSPSSAAASPPGGGSSGTMGPRGALTILALSVLASAPLHAEVFRCGSAEAPLYSDRRCSAESEVIKLKPAAGQYDQLDDVHARMRTARGEAELRRIESARDANRLAVAREIEAGRQASLRRCDEIREKIRVAESQAEILRRPERVQREAAKAKRWKDRLWWECKTTD